jgi:phosphate transport system protein
MTREHYQALLRGLDNAILEMGDLVCRTIGEALDTLEQRDAAGAQMLIQHDTEIDNKRYDIERDALLLIATQQPLAGDLRTVAAILTVATELERIGDYCEGIAKLTLRMAAEPVDLPLTDIRTMADITQHLLQEVLRAYRDRDLQVAGEVWLQDTRVDDLYEDVFRNLLAEMVTDRRAVRRNTFLVWIAHNLERMADRVTNIAERVAFVVNGDVAGFRNELRAASVPE